MTIIKVIQLILVAMFAVQVVDAIKDSRGKLLPLICSTICLVVAFL